MSHTAVILIALGGPRSLEEVGPFMSVFTGRPMPSAVVELVTERYKLIGGKSPLPDIVKAQAHALKKELGSGCRVYEGFRYSRPSIAESFEKAVKDGASHIIGLSMSPFETEVTTGVYRKAFESLHHDGVRKTFISSWHDNPLFIEAWEEHVYHGIKRFWTGRQRHVVVIFTSHSIPVRCISAGDPYQQQIEETIALVVHKLNIKHWRIAWQSKGARATEPWLEPEVEKTLDRIAHDGHKAVLEVPIGFTCDHLETLYDIEIVHRKHAEQLGLTFERAESLNTSPLFITALADIIKKAL